MNKYRVRHLANANSNLQYCEMMPGSIRKDTTGLRNILLLLFFYLLRKYRLGEFVMVK